MKKYKIGNKAVYANSLHDALEIYKHKVKDKEEEFKPGDKVRYHAFGFSGWQAGIVTAKKETRYGTRYDLKLSGGFEKDGIPGEYLEKIRDSKVKDEVYYEDIDSSSEAKKYAKKFGLEVEGRRAPWGGYEFAFEGSPQDLKKLVQELKKIGIEPTWSSVGDSK